MRAYAAEDGGPASHPLAAPRAAFNPSPRRRPGHFGSAQPTAAVAELGAAVEEFATVLERTLLVAERPVATVASAAVCGIVVLLVVVVVAPLVHAHVAEAERQRRLAARVDDHLARRRQRPIDAHALLE